MKMRPKDIWGNSSKYQRGGSYKDKWKNTKTEKVTYRDSNNGRIYDSNGKLIGQEINHKHAYGSDPKKGKGWHSQSVEHKIAALKRRR